MAGDVPATLTSSFSQMDGFIRAALVTILWGWRPA
jgi:hypothetical protein